MTKSKYDRFHNKTSIQRKVISENNFTYILLLPIINKYLKPNAKILDIGSGAGTLALYIASKGHDALGIEISQKAVESARESAKILGLNNISFEVMNFPNQIPDGKFDMIIFTEVIEHLKNDNKALNKISSLLNENGTLILSTPSVNAPLHRLGLTKSFDKKVGHLRRYSIDELKRKCEENELEVVEAKKIEGTIRNFLFTNEIAGKLVRFIKFYISDIVTFADNLTVPLFGESNIIIVAKKL